MEAQRSRMQSDVETYTVMLHRILEEAGTQSVRTIGDNVTLAATGAQASIRHSLDEIGRAIGEFASAQTAMLDAREVDAARAAAIGDAAVVRAANVADEIEAVGARVGAALRQVGEALERSAEAIEGAGGRIQQAEEAANAARRAAEESADAAARSARDTRRSSGWWLFRGRG